MASLAGRRLADLLQEQQEPFLLDVYLLENGYSGRILCSEATATCWPAGDTACRRLQKLACSHGFRRRGERVLGSLLVVFSRKKPPKSSTNWGGGPTSIMGAAPAKARRNRKGGRDLGKPKVEAERARVWECTEEEAKQLSPVSVLELQSDDGSPAHEHAKEEGSSTSGLHAQVGAEGDLGGLCWSSSSHYNMGTHGRRRAPVLLEEERSRRHDQSEQRGQHLHGCLGSHRRQKARRRHLIRRRDAVAASHRPESYVSDDYSTRSWNLQYSNPHVMEIGAEGFSRPHHHRRLSTGGVHQEELA